MDSDFDIRKEIIVFIQTILFPCYPCICCRQLREKGKQLTNMRRSQTVERGRQALHMTDKMKQDSEADVQMSQLQV